MGLFSRKKKEVKKEEIPSLPELPKLPDLPKMEEGAAKPKPAETNQLPSFPTNSLGEKFSQNAIKEAVSGEKKGEEVDVNELVKEKKQEMHEPLQKSIMSKELPPLPGEDKKPTHSREIDEEEEPPIPREVKHKEISHAKSNEPVFIRIDKFEESLKVFEKIKVDVSEIEKMLKDIKSLKDEEGKELSHWEREMQKVKDQVSRVDEDIFSKIE